MAGLPLQKLSELERAMAARAEAQLPTKTNLDRREVFGALASLYINPTVVTAGERRGLYMLGVHTGLLTTLNSEAFKPKAF